MLAPVCAGFRMALVRRVAGIDAAVRMRRTEARTIASFVAVDVTTTAAQVRSQELSLSIGTRVRIRSEPVCASIGIRTRRWLVAAVASVFASAVIYRRESALAGSAHLCR